MNYALYIMNYALFYVSLLSSLVRMLSNSSAESLKRNSPLAAIEMPPVSSETTMAMASLSCEIPMAAR